MAHSEGKAGNEEHTLLWAVGRSPGRGNMAYWCSALKRIGDQ